METGNVWSLQASSTDLIRLLESFRLIDYEDRVQSVFAENLLSYSQCNKIVDDINQLSTREVVLRKNLSSQTGHAKSKSIHVFEVEVCYMQGTLKVNEKVRRRMMTETCIYFTFKIITDSDIHVVFYFVTGCCTKG